MLMNVLNTHQMDEQYSQMGHIMFPTTPCFLEGSWNQEPWLDVDFFDIHRCVHCFAPKFKF